MEDIVLYDLPTKQQLKKYLEKYEYVKIGMRFRTLILSKEKKNYNAFIEDRWKNEDWISDETNFSAYYRDLKEFWDN